ncbi:hypothetical protein Dimus_003642, partial [Dionaea muscipula]
MRERRIGDGDEWDGHTGERLQAARQPPCGAQRKARGSELEPNPNIAGYGWIKT